MLDTSSPMQTLKIGRCGSRDAGHALGLRSGDILIAVEGQLWAGNMSALNGYFSKAKAPLLLTFLRQATLFSVLCADADLGRWDITDRPEMPEPLPQPSLRLCNWQIMVNADGQHDLFAMCPSRLALVCAPLWLAKERMFTWLAALAAALALALPGGLALLAGVWLAAGLHLWRHGARHLAQARQAEGYRPIGVVAARSETEARRSWADLVPAARFRYDSAGVVPDTLAEQLSG